MIDLNDARPQRPEGVPRAQERYIRTDDARRLVKGCEAEIVRALGIPWHGRGHIRCPYRDHDDHNPSWRLMDDGRAICTCRGPHSVFDVIAEIEGCDFEAAKIRAADLVGAAPPKPKGNGHDKGRRRTDEETARDIAFILKHGESAPGTLVETYLASRGLELPDCRDLLFHPNLTDWGEKRGRPAMVTVVRRPESGEETGGIWRTYLADDGSAKADMPKAKMGRGPVAGGVAMLMPMTADGTLGIAEGQETALAASKIFRIPVWAGLSAGGVRGFIFPPDLKKLLIFADRGEDGEVAADTLCRRALADGIDALVYLPNGNDDFADDLTLGYSVGDYQPEQPPVATPRAATGTPEPPAGSLTAVIERFNAQYAVVNEAGIAIIYEQMPDLILNRKTLVRISFADLKKFYQNELITVARRGGSTTKSSAQWWLDDPRRRQYLGGVVFDPTGAAPEKCWNLWSGYSVEPAPGDWSLMRQHIERVICAGNAAHAEYLLNWIARMFQQPNRPGEVAVVLRGLKGSGKGILFTWLAKAWGQHGVHITNAKHLVGNFNAHLRDAVMLFADEAFFAGDRQHESVLKGLITEPTLPIEGKYQNVVQVANMLHVGMASNSDWVVPATRDERRFFALDVADNRVGDRRYFTAIIEQMKAGGLAALIYDMLRQDISAFEVRDIPHTEALDDQKRLSLDSLDKWLIAILERGFVWRSRYGIGAFSEWHEFVATELLNRSYQQWCGDYRVNRPMTREQLGRRLADIYQTARPRGSPIIGEVESATLGRSGLDLIVKKDRAPGYQLGSLDEARARFADQRGVTGDWMAEP